MAYNQSDWNKMMQNRRKRLENAGLGPKTVITRVKVDLPVENGEIVAKLDVKPQKVQLSEIPEPTYGSDMRRKVCAKCGNKKTIDQFPKHSGSSDGFASYCKVCKNQLNVDRRKKDPVARIKHYTVTRLQNEWGKENCPADLYTNLEHYLGYELWQLKAALKKELKEREGITLQEAFERKYHLDHRVPHTSFKSEEIGDEEFKKCWAISNLWLIPASVNLQKGASMDFDYGNFDEESDED